MKKYFIKTQLNVQPKNKAWEAAQNFAQMIDCTLITGDELLNGFISAAAEKISGINTDFPKCKNLSCSQIVINEITAPTHSLYVTVDGDQVFSLSIFAVKVELSDN